MGILVKTLITGVAALYGLSELGKKINSAQSKQFVMSVDHDILVLAKQCGVTLDPRTKCFSEPIQEGQLPAAIKFIELTLRTDGKLYKRTVKLTVQVPGHDSVVQTALREYDTDHMPTEVVSQFIKHGQPEMSIVIYKN